jgi:uncharacterized membrane protein YfcA
MDGLIVVAGAATGLLVGMTGVGGGALMTPLLLLVFGIAPMTAVGTDLWFAATTKLVASRVHHGLGLVDWQVVRRLWAGSLTASLVSMLWLSFNPVNQAWSGFWTSGIAVVVLLTAVGMVLQGPLHAYGRKLRLTEANHFKAWQLPLTIVAGAVLGVLVSFTSIGAGALGAVFLTYLYPLRLTPSRLIATDIVHAIPLAIFAGLGHLILGNVNFALLGNLLAGSVPGVILGAMLSSRLPDSLLRWVLGFVLFIVGGKLLWSAM